MAPPPPATSPPVLPTPPLALTPSAHPDDDGGGHYTAAWLADTSLVTPSDLPFASRSPPTDLSPSAHEPSPPPPRQLKRYEADENADRDAWVQAMHASDYRGSPLPSQPSPLPAANADARDAAAEGDDERDSLASPPPPPPADPSVAHGLPYLVPPPSQARGGAHQPHPSPAAAAPPQHQQQQPVKAKRPGVGFSSTVQVRADSLSRSSSAGSPGGGDGGGTYAPYDVSHLGGGESGLGGGGGGGRGRAPPQHQTASLWQAEPSPTTTSFCPPPPLLPSTNARSSSPSKSYGAPQTDEYEPSYRPSYARSESEASSFSQDELGDDEDVLYDWSGEEDLVDQEAKHEEKLGLRKGRKKGWGPVRCVLRPLLSLSLLRPPSSPADPPPSAASLFTALFSTVVGSTVLAGCLVAVPLCVHYLWEKPHPTDHRKYVSVRRPPTLLLASSPVRLPLTLLPRTNTGERRTTSAPGSTFARSTCSCRGTWPS